MAADDLRVTYVLTAKGVKALKIACEALREIAGEDDGEHSDVAASALLEVYELMDGPGPTAARFP